MPAGRAAAAIRMADPLVLTPPRWAFKMGARWNHPVAGYSGGK